MNKNITVGKGHEAAPARDTELRTVLPGVNVYENNEEILLQVEIPGAERDGININLDNGKLTIAARRKFAGGTNPIYTEFGPVAFHRAKRRATAAAPSLLKPRRLIKARCRGRRNTRGFGFPGCARAVTVPISTKPNPINGHAGKAVAFLSIPAAKPTALGKRTPKHSTARPSGAET